MSEEGQRGDGPPIGNQPPFEKNGEPGPQVDRGRQDEEPAQTSSLAEARHHAESSYLTRAGKYSGLADMVETLPDEFSDAEFQVHMSNSPLYDAWGSRQERIGVFARRAINSQLALKLALDGGARARNEVVEDFREAAQREIDDGRRVGDWAEILYLHRPSDFYLAAHYLDRSQIAPDMLMSREKSRDYKLRTVGEWREKLSELEAEFQRAKIAGRPRNMEVMLEDGMVELDDPLLLEAFLELKSKDNYTIGELKEFYESACHRRASDLNLDIMKWDTVLEDIREGRASEHPPTSQ